MKSSSDKYSIHQAFPEGQLKEYTAGKFDHTFSNTGNLKDELYSLIRKEKFFFDFIQESAVDGICYFEIEGNERTWCNPKFWNTLGYQAGVDKVDRDSWLEHVHPEDLPEAQKLIQKLCQKPGLFSVIDLRYRHKAGSILAIRTQALSIGDEKGGVVRIMSGHTILPTDSVKTEQLHTRLQFFEDLIGASDLGAWEWRKDDGIIRVNERYATQLGYHLEDLIPLELEQWRQMIHPDDLEHIDEVFIQHEKKETDRFESTFRVRHKGGHWVSILNKSKIIKRNEEGQGVWMVGTHQDVSEQVKARKSLLKTQEFLERTNEVGRIGYWEINLKNNALFWSSVTKEIHGVPNDYQPELSTGINFYKEGGDRDTIKRLVEECINHQKPFDHELTIINQQGEELWVRSMGQAEVIDGEVTRIYGVFQDIDQFVKARKELELREEELNAIFSSSASGIATLSLEGDLHRVNNRFCELLGYTEQEALTLNYHDIVPRRDIDDHNQDAQDLLQGNKDHIVAERAFIKNSGDEIMVIHGGSVVRDNHSTPLYFTLELIDISELQEISDRLKESERRFKGIFDTAFQFIVFLETDGTLIEINETALAFADISLEEVKNKKIWETYWWNIDQHSESELKMLVKRAREGELVQRIQQIKDDQGQLTTIDFSLKPMLDEEGNVAFLIAEGRRIQDIIDAQEQAEQARDHLEAVFNASTKVSIIETDRSGVVQFINSGAEHLLGWRKPEILGEAIHELILPSDEIKKWEKEISEESPFGRVFGFDAVIEKVRVNDFQGIRTYYTRKDGSKVPVLLTVSSFQLDEQDSYLAIASDFSAIDKAQNEVQALLGMTQAQNERLMNFAHIVSHNLRSHSSNIRMLLDLMNSETPKATENEFFPMLQQASTQLKETINHLNDVVSINLRSQDDLKSIKLIDSIHSAISSLNAQILEANAEIIIEVDPTIEIQAIPAYWESIILNLISNALKYRAKDRRARIRVFHEIDSPYHLISIQDNGLGINMEQHSKKVFGMYNTFHGNDDARGIGLFITKNQIESMGGKIELQSKEGLGSQFKVYLPI